MDACAAMVKEPVEGECALCLELIHRAKFLDCDHSFCHRCIQTYYVTFSCPQTGTIHCPLCRRPTHNPSCIVDDLPGPKEDPPPGSEGAITPEGSIPNTHGKTTAHGRLNPENHEGSGMAGVLSFEDRHTNSRRDEDFGSYPPMVPTAPTSPDAITDKDVKAFLKAWQNGEFSLFKPGIGHSVTGVHGCLENSSDKVPFSRYLLKFGLPLAPSTNPGASNMLSVLSGML